MASEGSAGATLFATSDLHVHYPENRTIVDSIRPSSDSDWLIVAGDVGEIVEEIEWALGVLSDRFEAVVWAPGNHELWTPPDDPVGLRGEYRYHHLVEVCRGLGVHTPEDPYPVWQGAGGPVTIAPLFLLYDYTFRVNGARSKEESLARAYETGVVCMDEVLLHPDPYESREQWCAARLAATELRLSQCRPDVPLILVNHFPLVREPTRILHYQDFAQWCGTENTADWHRRFDVSAVVYGHLHIPRTTWHDGVRFEEVSLGYPREWRRRGASPAVLRQILPAPSQHRASTAAGPRS